MSTGETQRNSAIEATGIGKAFGGVAALSSVDLIIKSGEILGLAGANGAGKSTLINILTGQLRPDSGELVVDGKAVRFDSPRQAQRSGIGVVRQELDLVPDLTVAENLWLGDEREFRRFGMIDRGALNTAATALLARVGLDTDPRTVVRALSIGDRQLIAAARALRTAGSVLLLDEPTSSLTPFEAERLFAVMRLLRESGVGVVFISHRLDEVAALCDRVLVLRDGKVAGTFGNDQESMARVVEAMVPGAVAMARHNRTTSTGEVALRARGLRVRHRDPVDFDIRAGEILGVFGLVGAGKSTLGKALAGLVPSEADELTLEGIAYRPKNARQAFARGVASLSEDRRGEGILPKLSVRENVIVRSPRNTSVKGVFRSAAISELIAEMFDRLRVKAASDRLEIRDLSGGNQQKVLVARLLAEDLTMLVLDEPTHGIDIQAKQDLLTQVSQLAEGGLAVLMISSEIPELLSAADRILVMRNGHIVLETKTEDATEQILMSAATGGTK